MEYFTNEQAIEALEEAKNTKEQLSEMAEQINNYIFFLKYYLATGEALNPEVINLPIDDWPGRDSDD